MSIGSKIRSLRKQKNMSQETLAQYLGITYQSVSKWENGLTMPDATMIPAIASFFNVSCDELFDYNLLEIEMKVDRICKETVVYRTSNPAIAEQILKEGLNQYPGNDILLNNLLYTMRSPERNHEVIDLCKALIESTKMDDVKYDAWRILAETYAQMGEKGLVKEAVNQIPEIYFTKLELEALLVRGGAGLNAALMQKQLAAEMLMEMTECCAAYYQEKGEAEKAESENELLKQIKQLLHIKTEA